MNHTRRGPFGAPSVWSIAVKSLGFAWLRRFAPDVWSNDHANNFCRFFWIGLFHNPQVLKRNLGRQEPFQNLWVMGHDGTNRRRQAS